MRSFSLLIDFLYIIDIYKIEVWIKQGMSHKQIQDFLWKLAKETGLDFYCG